MREKNYIPQINDIPKIAIIFFISIFTLISYPLTENLILWYLIQIILLFLIIFYFFESFSINRQKYRKLMISSQNEYIFTIYFSILTFSIIIFNFIYPFIISENINQSLFQAILQTQSAVIAIIISLSILAVQFVSEKYSQRFGDLYKSLIEWKIFLGIFLISIICALTLILTRDNHNIWIIEIILVIFSFLLIPVFIWNSITMLRAENIIEYLTYDKFFREFDKPTLGIYIQLFFDLITYSYNNRDYVALETVKSYIIFINDNISGNPNFDLKKFNDRISEINEQYGHIKRLT